MIDKVQALRLIKAHGWKPTDQTATRFGRMFQHGTSFYDELGDHVLYSRFLVMEWLGY